MLERTNLLQTFVAMPCAVVLVGVALMTGCAGETSDEPSMAELSALRADVAAQTTCAPPAAWANPGKVAVPAVTAIPAHAGKTGKPFDQAAGMEEYEYQMDEYQFTGTSPAYTSRMVVRRPRDPAKFSGTVFVEWYNVSGGIDFAVLWASSREYFMREGHVFVGVSAQTVGVNALKNLDTERYGALKHPGDAAANAIFSQAGAALRAHSEQLLGACMPVRSVLAIGQSQSAFRLASYVNQTQPADRVYDGIMLHSGLEPATNNPSVPVFVVRTMNEGNGALTDGPNLVKWMVAGATHNDRRITTRGAEMNTGVGTTFECVNPVNNYPSYRVYNAALDGLEHWVRDGKRPTAGKPFELAGTRLAVDEHGNAKGGVRSADLDVPIAMHAMNNSPKNPLDFIGLMACGFGGTEVPFAPSKLSTLYPSHDDYVAKYTKAADAALAGGFWLQADYDEAVKQAQAAPIPK